MKFIALRDGLDTYHQQRADTHGFLYTFIRPVGVYGDVVEAKSIATGRAVTLLKPYYDEVEVPDAE